MSLAHRADFHARLGAEAERLVVEKEGRLCVRFHRRADGTVLTRDCPVGLRRWLARAAISLPMTGIVDFNG
jgi:hypothetical protein